MHTLTRFETKNSEYTSERPQTNVLDRSAIAIGSWFSIYMRSIVLLGVLSIFSCLNCLLVYLFLLLLLGFVLFSRGYT